MEDAKSLAKKAKLEKLRLLKRKLEAKKQRSDPKAEQLLSQLSRLSEKKRPDKSSAKEQRILQRTAGTSRSTKSKKVRQQEKLDRQQNEEKSKPDEDADRQPQPAKPVAKKEPLPKIAFPLELLKKYDLFLTVRHKQSRPDKQRMVELIRQAAGQRVKQVELIEEYVHPKQIKLGLIVDNEHLLTPITLGPDGDAPEAAEFRSFWGDKSELRRFEDGTIKESVFWTAKNLCQARSILLRSLNHALESHLQLSLKSDFSYDNTHLQNAITYSVKPFTIGTGEQYRQMLLSAKDDLDKTLRALPLRLKVKDVKSASAALRGTEVCYEPPVLTQLSFAHSKKDQYLLKPTELVLHLEQSSSHWPVKLSALRSIKTAFFLDIHDQLEKLNRPGLSVKFHTEFVDVLLGGYVFRLRLFVQKELTLLQNGIGRRGQRNRAQLRESLQLEKELSVLPQLASHLASLNQQSLNFGTACRLAKVWCAAHFLTDYLSELAVELIVAKVYLDDPDVYYLRGFVLFLELLATFDWYRRPLLVNLNGDFTDEQLAKIDADFAADRSQFPLLAVCTPFDTVNSMWTRDTATPLLPVIVGRLVKLARDAYLHLAQCISNSRNDFIDAFVSPTDIFDAVILLNSDFVPNFHYGLRRNESPGELHRHCILYHVLCSKCQQSKAKPVKAPFPLVQRNHVQVFLRLLREHYGQLALFFYDEFGGDRVGVLWRPEARQPVPLDLEQMQGYHLCELADEQGQTRMQPNLDEMLEDFELIGGQLVKQIQVKGGQREKSIIFPSTV